MKIIYKTNAIERNMESKFTLKYERKREDIKKLLLELKQGTKLKSIFHLETVTTSISNLLSNEGFIDDSKNLTAIGEKFIKKPYMSEEETGIYSLNEVSFDLDKEKLQLAYAFERTLSNIKANQVPININNLIKSNEFTIGNQEDLNLVDLNFVDQEKKGYVVKEQQVPIIFDLSDSSYQVNQGRSLKMGSTLKSKALNHAKRILESNPYGRFDLDTYKLYVKSLKEFSDKEIVQGRLYNYGMSGLEIADLRFAIEDIETAITYAYKYMYHMLKGQMIYSFKEMDEIFQNELLSSDIFTEEVKVIKDILNFKYSMNGFKSNLSTNEFDNLSYKLRILDEFLDVKVVDNEFTNAEDYDEIVDKFKSLYPGSEVKHLYMVMGYPFAKNSKTRTYVMAETFLQEYSNITIVSKGINYGRDADLEKSIIDLGVQVKDVRRIGEHFHDRYVIFELNNNTYEAFLVTCELGQYFNIKTHEATGSIIKINISDLKKDNTNLISMIKE